jgi:YesN/AraC family two-component response regulator
MNAVAFDTLKTARALEVSGMPRAHAEAIAEQLAEGRTVDLSDLATKAELKAEVAKLATKEELKAEVAKLATKEELKHEVALLDQRITLAEQRIIIKLGGMLVVITGVLLAAIRYLPQAG